MQPIPHRSLKRVSAELPLSLCRFCRKWRALPPFAVPPDSFPAEGLEAALEQSRPCGHRGEEGGKAVASELKELRLVLDDNQIGPGPRRALSDPEEGSPRAALAWGGGSLYAQPYSDPGAERGSIGASPLCRAR